MAMKDVPDTAVVWAYWVYQGSQFKSVYPHEALSVLMEQPEKVCYRACERAHNRGYIECGVSLRTGWLTPKGKELLATVMEGLHD